MKLISIIIIFQTLLFSGEMNEANKTKDAQTHMETVGGKEVKIVTMKDLRNRIYRSGLHPDDFKVEQNNIETAEGEIGKEDAINDFENGVYRLEIYGYRKQIPKLVYYYRKLLLEKYDITIDRVAGCVINKEVSDRTREYNKAMIIALKKKFGEDIFFKTKMEAIEMYTDKIRKK